MPKINNSYLQEKQQLRIDVIHNLERKNVLDAFAGDKSIWSEIDYDTYVGIDKVKTDKIDILKGDNRKYLKSMDLSGFNIIDLDSYGIPFDQIELIYQNKTLQKKTYIFFTFIQLKNSFGALPLNLLIKIGYTKTMVKKIPTLFNRNGFNKF